MRAHTALLGASVLATALVAGADAPASTITVYLELFGAGTDPEPVVIEVAADGGGEAQAAKRIETRAPGEIAIAPWRSTAASLAPCPDSHVRTCVSAFPASHRDSTGMSTWPGATTT